MPKQTGVWKLPNGRYRARFFQGYDGKGRRVYPSRVFDLQSEALNWRDSQRLTKRGGRVEGQRLTVSEHLDRWLKTKTELRENSREMYRQSLDDYVKPTLGHVKLRRLTSEHIAVWQAELLGKVSKSTAASARTILNGALKYAVKHRMIDSNPIELTEAPKRPPTNRYPMSVEEAAKIVQASAGFRFGLLIEMLLRTGLRPEELFGLRWPDLDLSGERGILHVRRVVHKLKGGGWRFHDPKSQHGIRSVVFPSELAAKLLEHRRRQLEQKLKAGPSWQSHDLVFTTKRGTPVRLCALQVEFKAIAERVGLPKAVRLYDARHFFVTLSLVAGVDPKTVSREAGHSKVSFTLEHYGHVLREMAESASDRRENLMRGRG